MKKKLKGGTILSVIVWCCVVTVSAGDVSSAQQKGGSAMQLVSSAFGEGAMVPVKYTCDGENVSPPLAWNDVPEKVKSFALICDDPDAPMGTWVHWVVYNISPDVKTLAENVPKADSLPDGTRQGVSDFRKPGYGGPCPPGGTHRYYFRLYALDAQVSVDAKMTKKKLLEAMEGHVLAEAMLMGKYKRSKGGR